MTAIEKSIFWEKITHIYFYELYDHKNILNKNLMIISVLKDIKNNDYINIKMEIQIINNKKYYAADEIIKKAPIYSKGVKSAKELMTKKEISETKYIYARLNGDNWIKSDGSSRKYDKIFIIKSYADTLEKIMKEINGSKDICDDDGIEKAPDVIDLNDNEKFKDDKGNILEIETRGERECDKIYFKVKDVAKSFDMKSLYDVLKHKDGGYIKDDHYKYFISEKTFFDSKKKDKNNKVSKELFLTYNGILRVLFASRNNKTACFVKWATEKLFTLQMGTVKQKHQLIADEMGVDASVIAEIFDKDASSLYKPE